MTKQYTLQEALKMAIENEKESMDFYRKAGSITKDARSKQVFDLLAREELDHLKAFFGHYQGGELGDLESFVNRPIEKGNSIHQALEGELNEEVNEQKALEIALAEEKSTIELYTMVAREMNDANVRKVFETVIRETQKHHDIIEDEYMRVMTMVHESDQNIYVRDD